MNERPGSPAGVSLWKTIDLRPFILALGTFAIGTDAFIIAGVVRHGHQILFAVLVRTL